jgi:hypothetical protein
MKVLLYSRSRCVFVRGSCEILFQLSSTDALILVSGANIPASIFRSGFHQELTPHCLRNYETMVVAARQIYWYVQCTVCYYAIDVARMCDD